MEGDGKLMTYTFAARFDPLTDKPSDEELQIMIPARSKEEAEKKLFRLIVPGTTALWKYLFSYEY